LLPFGWMQFDCPEHDAVTETARKQGEDSSDCESAIATFLSPSQNIEIKTANMH